MFLLRRRCFIASVIITALAGCKINDPAQKVSVTASLSASEVSAGDPLTLEWTSTLAKSCSITSTSGIAKEVQVSGKESFNPLSDEAYTVACQPSIKGDKAGSASAAAKVIALAKASLEAKTAQIYLGDSVELSWACENAEKADLTANGQSTVGLTLTGSQLYTPTADVEYELACENKLGKKTASKASVSVLPLPKVEMTMPAAVYPGDQFKLTWKAEYTEKCSLFVAAKEEVLKEAQGEMTMTQAEETAYRISCADAFGKAVKAEGTVKMNLLPAVTLTAKVAQITLGETVELTWTSKNAASCELFENDKILEPIAVNGTQTYEPEADADYKILCQNTDKKVADAKTQVIVIQEVAVKPKFTSFEALDKAIDVTAMKTDCGPSCIWQQYDTGRFEKDPSTGGYHPTADFSREVKPILLPEKDRVQLLTSKTAAFDINNTLAYGHRLALADSTLNGTCNASFPLQKDSVFQKSPEFLDEIEKGSEKLVGASIPLTVAYDIEISSKAIRGVMKKDKAAIVSYKLAGVDATREATFTDFDRVKGSYKLNPDGSLKFTESPRGLISTRAASFPTDGWLVSAPPAGTSGNNYYPEPPLKNYFGGLNPFQNGCLESKTPYYQVCVNEAGDVLCRYDRAQPINQKPGWVKIRSPRVIAAQGQAQCNLIFPEIARTYSLGNDWTATSELQYFVTDAAYPSNCSGANCIGKIARDSENDWRSSEVEPGNNRCINRWQGLDWNQYRARLESSCNSSPLYIAARDKAIKEGNDANFATACTGACLNALNGMKELGSLFSAQVLTDLLDKEILATANAKASGLPYLINEAKLSPSFIASARGNLNSIEAGIETVQTLHTQNSSSWISGNLKVHKSPSVYGFDSYNDSKASIIAYKRQLDRADILIRSDIKDIACTYEGRGRFRKFSGLKDPVLSFPVRKQQSFTTKLKEDTTVIE
jgi:hypothetical protein